MASMRHPNVVMYLGVCLQPPCVVTEYCARGSLNDVFKRARATPALAAQLDWGRRLNMVLDAAKGMMYLHSSEPPVIHRDLKSPNLLVDKHWRLKVCAMLCPSFLSRSLVLCDGRYQHCGAAHNCCMNISFCLRPNSLKAQIAVSRNALHIDGTEKHELHVCVTICAHMCRSVTSTCLESWRSLLS